MEAPMMGSRETLSILPPVTLASSLLDLELDFQRQKKSTTFSTGIKSVEVHLNNLFCPGRVNGLGSIEHGNGESNLSSHLVLNALCNDRSCMSVPQCESGTANIYVIAPPSTTVISEVHSLLETYCTSAAATPPGNLEGPVSDPAPEEKALALLDSVQLLQYLDLAGLAESLSEVSDTLFANYHSQSMLGVQESVLLIQGLSPALATMQRRRGIVHANALLANLLKTLTLLSRSYAGLLILVEVGIEITGGSGDLGKGSGDRGYGRAGGEIASAFSSPDGSVMRVEPRGVVGELLEKSMDVLALVHDRFDKLERKQGTQCERIVEVVKDRCGQRFGEWTIWAEEEQTQYEGRKHVNE